MTLMVSKEGTGAGTVTSSPLGIHCESTTCTANYSGVATVTLTATPDAGHAFTGWSGGGCSGTGQCVVTVASSVNITATFLPLLDLAKAGTGTGTVTGSPAGQIGSDINCGTACASDSAAFNIDTVVILTAASAAGNVFAGWSGSGCSGTGQCVVTMSAPQSVTATFLPIYRLNVAKAGLGRGNITGAPAGIASAINCGTGCVNDSADYAEGTAVTLTAIPDPGYAFTGWSGDECTGTAACVLTMNTVKNVTATFATAPYRTLSLTKVGTGTVTGSPAGISSDITCGTACVSDSADYSTNTVVTLTAVADAGHTFTGWSRACSGTAPCVVTMSAAKSVTATFAQDTYTLTAPTAGANGTITPAGAKTVNNGASQTYTITADAGYHIVDVTVDGASVGAVGSYTFTAVTANHTITATFAVNTYAMSVSRNGTGTGMVTSAPAGISCGADCAETYNHGTPVTLTATADASSSFSGWSGACTGTGTCVVTMDAVKNVAATFTPLRRLNVVKAGTGRGTVTGSPAGIGSDINCGTGCPSDLADFSHGTPVTLTVAPDNGHTFTGWSGACTGTGTCVVTMDAAKSVTATFTINTYGLNVSKSGTGTGLITSSPAGISCGADCAETYNLGTPVTLTAVADAGHTLTGWSGACTGTGPCVVTMSAAKSVTAAFIDITKPALAIDPVTSPTNQDSQTLSGIREALATITANCPTATVGNVAYPDPTTWSVVLTSLSPGANNITVTAMDAAANESTLTTVITLDIAAPVMTITINDSAPYAKNTSVTLNLSASADAEVTQFKNETGDWTPPETYSTIKSWTLSAGDGTKTVSAKVRDAAGNWSPPSDATIILDTVAPVTTASPTGGFIGKGAAIALFPSEAATIYYTIDGSTPQTGSPVYTGPIPLFADTTVKFLARDLAGNLEETVRSATYRIAQPGDVNLSDVVDIADAILAAQVLAGITPAGTVYQEADVNGDGMIGLPEVIYILQKAAGLR